MTPLLFRSANLFSFQKRSRTVFQVAKREEEKISFWMQTSHPAFQNESLHLIVPPPWMLKAGMRLRQSWGYIKAEHCLQRGRSQETSKTFVVLDSFSRESFLFRGKEEFSWASPKAHSNSPHLKTFVNQNTGRNNSNNLTGNQKGNQYEVSCVRYQRI